LAGAIGATAFVHLAYLKGGDGAVDENADLSSAWAYVHGHFTLHLEHPPLTKFLFGYAEELLGKGYTSARLVSAIAGVATAIILAVWAYRLLGIVAAVSATALWSFLPHGAVMDGYSVMGFRIERYAYLDPIATCFAALALWAGWEARSHASKTWIWAALAGAGVGLAATAKAPGFLVVPVIFGALVFVPHIRTHWKQVLARAVAFGVGFVGAAALPYIPFGVKGAVHQIRFMFAFQESHARHPILLGNHLTDSAPWWAGLRFMADGMTWPGTALLVGLALVGLFSKARGAAIYGLLAATTTFVGVAMSHRMLPHYYVVWLPGLVLAGGIGAQYLVQLARGRKWRLLVVPAWTVGVVAMATFAVLTVQRTGPGDYTRTARVLIADRVRHVYLIGSGPLLQHVLPQGIEVSYKAPRDDQYVNAVIADRLTMTLLPQLARQISAWADDSGAHRYQFESIGRLDLWVRQRA
jgi:4-amino-4-deoxy-L-arabinose transferase-like glycosyltransferase